MGRLFQMTCSSQCYSKSCLISLSNIFPIPYLWRFSSIIQSSPFIPIVHLFTIQPCTQVSVLLSSFSDFLWRIVVDNTIQRSSPHYCGQESCCNAFNAVVAAFPQDIFAFLSFPYSSEVYLRHWNFLECYISQGEVDLTDICQV